MRDLFRVLIVEDSEAERFFLRRTILRCRPNAEIVECAYGAEGLEQIATCLRPFDRIFVDINMPRMDGFTFANAFAGLREELRGRGQIWVVSHSIDPADREHAEAHPCISGFLSKTYLPEEIDQVLQKSSV